MVLKTYAVSVVSQDRGAGESLYHDLSIIQAGGPDAAEAHVMRSILKTGRTIVGSHVRSTDLEDGDEVAGPVHLGP